jgi:hypothetical protein
MLSYDYLAPRAELEEWATEATEIWLRLAGPSPAAPSLLLGEGGAIAVDQWIRLLDERDERPLTIVE